MSFSSFSERARAHMEIALECACDVLPKEFDTYEVRRPVASEIMKAAQQGKSSLPYLAYVGEKALNEFCHTDQIQSEYTLPYLCVMAR